MSWVIVKLGAARVEVEASLTVITTALHGISASGLVIWKQKL